jgi:3-oxoacyl-[acyl-carrier protein] reductase
MSASGLPADGGWLRDRRVWVLSSGHDILSGLAAGLADNGARVGLASDDSATLAPDGATRTSGAFDSQAAADDSVRRLAEAAGEPDLVVLSVLPDDAMRLAPLADFDGAQWQAGACDGLRNTLYLLRALGPHIKERGVAVVMVGPSLSLVGCPNLVALTTLLEGQRGLMKSVARQWGASGVSLNWIAAAPRALSPVFDAAPLAAKPDAVSVALGRPLDPRRDIAPIVGFLGSPAGRAITGMTLTLDGGEWMVP